jgi:hypothetical protein
MPPVVFLGEVEPKKKFSQSGKKEGKVGRRGERYFVSKEKLE